MTFNKGFYFRAATIYLIVLRTTVVLLVVSFISSRPAPAADFPRAKISNGLITAKIYLPDAKNGYYRSTRFDWSGALYSLQYKNHDFYDQWFDRIDPKVINWVHQGPEIVSGPCSGLFGPIDEFETPLGWNEAKPGGTFIKIGVGVLRKGEGNYDRFVPYEILDCGTWSVKKASDWIEFTQELSDTGSGYAYKYRKLVRLVKGKPEMVIEHSLKNTGKRVIQSDVYNHNFVVLDKQPPGPDFTIKLPYQIQSSPSLNRGPAEARGNKVVFMKTLSGEDEAVVFLQGFSDNVKDHEIVIENQKMGAGMRITGDRPLLRSLLWSVRTVFAIEPYISINIQSGSEFTWKDMIEYYTMP